MEARRLLDATEAALHEDGAALLAPPEREAVAKAMYTLAEQLETGEDLRLVRQATDALNAATAEFAARRMDAHIRKALSGRTLETL